MGTLWIAGIRIITYTLQCKRNKERYSYARDITFVRFTFLYIYTRDHQPPHVDVTSADGEAKFSVGEEVTLMANHGMRKKDVHLAQSIIEENKVNIVEKWTQIHG